MKFLGILVTRREGGKWYPIDRVKPPYGAIMFVELDEPRRIWDCVLRRWR